MSDDNSDPRRANKKDQPEKRGVQGGLSASGDSLTRLGSGTAEGASRRNQPRPVQAWRQGPQDKDAREEAWKPRE